jgi:hypothetical protein
LSSVSEVLPLRSAFIKMPAPSSPIGFHSKFKLRSVVLYLKDGASVA